MNLDDLRDFIRTEILKEPEAELSPDQDLLLSEVLDSLDVVRLVEHLESTCSVKIPAQDVTLENFATLRAITDYVSSLQSP